MEFNTFQELEDAVSDLFEEKKFEQIIKLYSKNMNRFPDHKYQMSWETALCYGFMDKVEIAMDLMEYGMYNGYFYQIQPGDELFSKEPYTERYEELIRKNELLKEERQRISEMEYRVRPHDYLELTPHKKPLFIALHGWGENIKFFMNKWRSVKLETAFVNLFVQSSLVSDYNGYRWDNEPLAISDVMTAYNQMKEIFNVKSEALTMGGFSQGGKLAFDMCLKTDMDIRNIVALCPGFDYVYNDMQLNRLAEKLERVLIITGENDHCLEVQKELIDALRLRGLDCDIIILEGLGHWFPKNLSELLDEEVDKILK